MKRLREALEIVLLVAFIGFILLLAYFTIHGARKVKALGDETTQTLTDLRRTIVIAANAAADVQKGVEVWKKQSDAQSKQSTQALTNLNAAAKSLDSLLISTDKSLNLSLLPSLSAAINDQNEALKKSEANIDAAVTIATATIEDADRVVSSPRLPEAVDNLADSSKSVAIATAAGAATMQKVQSGVTYEVDQIEKPVKKVKVIFLFILTALGRFFGFA
jgi:hypothetical protein